HDAGRDHAREPHGLELEPGQRAVRVGQEHLIDGEADLFADDRLAGDEVTLDQLARQALAHHSIWGGASAAPPPNPPTAPRPPTAPWRAFTAFPSGPSRGGRGPCSRRAGGSDGCRR